MKYRQVHLDFHTSEKIPGIGSEFSKEQFQEMLRLGHVDSITLFAKCHHGWAYHPTEANEMHPNLDFDLLGAQLEAAHEIGVETPVYISAGLDEKMARRHPEWVVRNKDESTTWAESFSVPWYHKLCFNSPYLDYLLEQVREVCTKYDVNRIFLDIVGVQPCYCQNCIRTLIEEGLDPYDESNILNLSERVYENYCNKIRETVDSVRTGISVFHNSGHIKRGRRDLAGFNSHLELESLPTGDYNYDHFPLSAGYARNLKMDFLSMTGKFHTAWGEFGGYKHPNALRYETALAIANGAKCSVGDQLHPSGKMDENTYYIIGKAYEEIEKKEEWIENSEFVADVAILSVEPYLESITDEEAKKSGNSDSGAVRILLEGKYLFDVIDEQENFEKYKVIILPDIILINEKLKEKIKEYVKNGGKILASGYSGLNENKSEFSLDFGIEYKGENEFCPSYFRPDFEIPEYKNAAFVIYSKGKKIDTENANILGVREDPYFNRSVLDFCSHKHTPSCGKNCGAAMVEGNDGIYIAWSVFEEYAKQGSLILKRMVQYALDRLLGDLKTITTNLPAQGIITYAKQKNRMILHMLYASPVKRGDIEIIEDINPIYNTYVKINTEKKIKSIYIAPEKKKIEFKQEKNSVCFVVPEFENHTMVVLEE